MGRKGQEGVPNGYKRCSKCWEVKGVGEFTKVSRAFDGLSCECKKCKSLRAREYREKNTGMIKEAKKEYYINNKDKISKKHSTYYKINMIHIIEYRKKYKTENHQRLSELNRIRSERYRKEHRGEYLERKKTRYIKNKEAHLAGTYFNSIGISVNAIPTELFEAKVLQIKLIHAIKAQKESHKEVTNG